MPPHQPQTGRRLEIIDLFAGPGGLDVGATWLGIPITGIEWDENACATRLAAKLTTEQGDVRDYGPARFPDARVLTGGPPCQTFTVAGAGSGRRALDDVADRVIAMGKSKDVRTPLGDGFSDERTGLVLEPLRWALEAIAANRPYEAIVLEQVPAVLPIWEAYRVVLEQHGYNTVCGILQSEEFGVPQTRRRAILIARLGEEAVRLPAATHQAYRSGRVGQSAIGLQPWVSMSDALSSKTAFTVISNYGSGGDPRNRGQRHFDEPSATVTGKIMRNRLQLANGDVARLSHHEAGVLQTFPPDFPWSGNDIGQQIGNAIPPRLAVHVLSHALRIPFRSDELDRVVRAPWEHSRSTPITMQPLGVQERMLSASD
jgi:DNA (cytosine-5)-methyltransferase 1